MNVSFISSNWSTLLGDFIQSDLMSLQTVTDSFNIDPIELSLRFEIERTVLPSFRFNSSLIPSSLVIFEIENALPFSLFYNNSSNIASTGLSANVIENNSTKILIKEPIECNICLDKLLEGSCMRRFNNCCHQFCVDCIDLWLHRCDSCLLCNVSVNYAYSTLAAGKYILNGNIAVKHDNHNSFTKGHAFFITKNVT